MAVTINDTTGMLLCYSNCLKNGKGRHPQIKKCQLETRTVALDHEEVKLSIQERRQDQKPHKVPQARLEGETMKG